MNTPNYNPVAAVREDRFLKFPHPIGGIFAVLGMSLLSLTYLAPQLIPTSILGPVGTLALFLAEKLPVVTKMLFLTAWSAHLIEAWLSVKLCRQKGIHPETTRYWCILTFFCGIFAMNNLVNYEPKKKQ